MLKRIYGKPLKRILDQNEIKKFTNEIGFRTEKIIQEWRHLIAFGDYENKKAVLKLASTQQTSKHTQNEYYWNDAVHLTPIENRQHFTVPQNYYSGLHGKLFYFIAEEFCGNSLIERGSIDTSQIADNLLKITVATYELLNLPIPQSSIFAKTQVLKKGSQTTGQKLLSSSIEWASQVPLDLDAYLKIIDDSKRTVKTSVGHGDFVPRQMYLVNTKIGIIDGEHAGLKGPRYYDAAQFFLRLQLDHNAKLLAYQYLLEFKNLLTPSDQSIFWEELKPVLIQRYIGELWGAKNDPQKLSTLQILGEEILNDKII